MPSRPKILLLDDEQDLLELYKEILSQLPIKPEIHLANSGARALAILESEPFNLLISDLRMPKMDGLQVLSIVRRKFPDLRVIVMTSVTDEQYRSRAYAMGVDLFWEKPTSSEEIRMFQDCIASLLVQKPQTGFRGVQNKSLVDLIQLECLSQSSSILKITNGTREGKIWILNGEITDAATGELSGHPAFSEIFSWRTGAFEILPPEPNRPRTIHESYQGILLDSVHRLDEAQLKNATAASDKTTPPEIARIARVDGVEFALETRSEEKFEAWGVEQPEPMSQWTNQTWNSLRELGEKLHAGDLNQVQALGLQRHAAIIGASDKLLCVGLKRTLTSRRIGEVIKKIQEQWGS